MRPISLFSATILLCWTAGSRSEDAPNLLDDDFLIKAASCENAVMQVGSLADKRAHSPKVRQFAALMVKDHQKINERLVEMIRIRKIIVAVGVDKSAQEDIDRLGRIEGVAFDREFLQCVIKYHRKKIEFFETQASKGKDTDIRIFAKNQLPTLREHLQAAESLSKDAK